MPLMILDVVARFLAMSRPPTQLMEVLLSLLLTSKKAYKNVLQPFARCLRNEQVGMIIYVPNY